MAGYIFLISSNEGLEGVKRCIKEGTYASIVPLNKASGEDASTVNTKSKQVVASVLADYCSMKAGDNVYFFSKRKIYGIGKLINIRLDCKYNNYLTAQILEYKEKLESIDKPLKEMPPEYRWICFFEPEEQFFENGVDMDEILQYKPSAFKVLRAFQDVTFIKIDDEENRALKECIYLKNRNSKNYLEFSSEEHDRISKYNLENYVINPEKVLLKEYNDETQEVSLEMLLEAWMVDKINKEGFEGKSYDYVTHQVIASPFKPLSYIDKMDIFAYRFLERYPDVEKPIEQYLVIELKKSKANEELPLQLMRYVDWISKEYASGDYSLIKAIAIAKEYKKGMQKVLDEECTRSYLSNTHPNKTSIWNDLKLYQYYLDESGKFQIKKSETFEKKAELKKYLEELGIKIGNSMITIAGERYYPIYKVQKSKWAFFEVLDCSSKQKLEDAGWKVVLIDGVGNREDIKELISSIF